MLKKWLIGGLSIALIVLTAATAGARVARAQGYLGSPVGGTYYGPAVTYGTAAQPWAAAPYGYLAYPSAPTATPSVGVDDASRIAALEARIRELESRPQGNRSSSESVIGFIDERGW